MQLLADPPTVRGMRVDEEQARDDNIDLALVKILPQQHQQHQQQRRWRRRRRRRLRDALLLYTSV